MTKFQFNLVKTFLDGFHVPPRKLATAWKIEHSEVLRVASSPNFEAYKENDMPLEDMMSAMGL